MTFFSTLPALPSRSASFIREARQELKTVQWPNRRDTGRATVVILVVSAIAAAVTGALDVGLTYLVEQVIQKTP
jgi:preprotein translocase SecE subunit